MDQSTRKAWMSLLAKAPTEQLKALWAATGLTPDHTTLRAPKVGDEHLFQLAPLRTIIQLKPVPYYTPLPHTVPFYPTQHHI